MSIFDYAEFTLEEKAARGLPLPDKLTIYDIVNLWVTSKRDREIYYDILYKAYNNGKGSLRGTKEYKDPCTQDDHNGVFFFGPYIFYQNICIAIDDFLDWLKNEGEPLPTDCLLVNWWKEIEPQAETVLDHEEPIKTGERDSQLHIFIWRVYRFLIKNKKKTTARKLWQEIQHRHEEHDSEGIIQEVTDSQISWRSCYGNEQTLSISSFSKTLTNIKKYPPE